MRRSRKELFGKMKRQRLKYITILPSLVTILNAVFGFAAIALTARGTLEFTTVTYYRLKTTYFAWAAYMIFFAMIADMLDGRLARMSHSTSSFGGQLDSLCDMVSFGIAPAFLVLKISQLKLATITIVHPALYSFFNRFIWLAAATYIACAAIRLARFNVENEEDETAHMAFFGLPTPAAAGVVTSIVLFHQQTLHDFLDVGSYWFGVIENVMFFSLPFIAIGIALLMISRVRYPHIVNQYVKGKKPFSHLIKTIFVIGLIWGSTIQTALLVIFVGFALWGVVRAIYRGLTRKRQLVDESPPITESGQTA
ncbi:MAG: CDP-alcohol phosphatidyltransferase family protein [Phycisphaerae bacterium]|nr:CDP-alcohol phosphatidyltransferase family protein [Phycisphaerae bacterium]